MKSWKLTRRSYEICFDWEFCKKIAFPFFLMVGVFSFSINPITDVFEIILSPFFMVILLSSFKSYMYNSNHAMPGYITCFKKACKLFLALILSSFIIILGFCFFIFPGVIFFKRYIYAFVVAEDELLGPINSIKKSNQLSMINGWDTLRTYFYFHLIFFTVIISIFLLFDINPIFLQYTLPNLFFKYIYTIGSTSILFLGYKEASQST